MLAIMNTAKLLKKLVLASSKNRYIICLKGNYIFLSLSENCRSLSYREGYGKDLLNTAMITVHTAPMNVDKDATEELSILL